MMRMSKDDPTEGTCPSLVGGFSQVEHINVQESKCTLNKHPQAKCGEDVLHLPMWTGAFANPSTGFQGCR